MFYKWEVFKRGDKLPENAVYAGNTATDGNVYVAKMDNSPGKVNLKDGKIWNFWSQAYRDSREESEVLISYGNCVWKEINNGDLIPDNAVYGGYDYNTDKVWVGKDITTDEPGKITCLDSNASDLKMCRLWCHSYTRLADVRKAMILTIEPKIEVPQQVSEKVTEDGIWGNTIQYRCCEDKIKATSVDISVDNIVKGIITTIAVSAGDISHLTSILKRDIKLHISNETHSSSINSESVINTPDEKYYVFLKYKKMTSDRRTVLGGIFNFQNSDFYLNVTYATLEPMNETAIEECREHKRELAKRVLSNFTP